MAAVTAPLLSFGASGQIAKTQVYSSWKGRPYVRRYVTPANPQSTEQSITRNTFSWLNSVWKIAPADFRTAWTVAAKGQVLTDRNLWIKKNLAVLRSMADLTGIIMSPGAKGGLVGTVVITPGNDLITVDGTPPDPLPAGWTVKRMIAAVIRQQDPASGLLYEITTMDDLTDPYSVVFTALESVQAYMVGAWFEYQKSALATDLAYGPSTGLVATTT
jgi:hypothetical protein